jgi:hypothetical protein
MFTFIVIRQILRGKVVIARLRSFLTPFDVQARATRSDFFPIMLPSHLLILQFITPG